MRKWFIAIPFAILEMSIGLVEIAFTSVTGFLGAVRVWLFRDYSYLRWLKRDLADCQSILDLGCGANSPILQIGLGNKAHAVDIFRPYVEMHNARHAYRRCTQDNILDMPFEDKAYDAVVICDVLEHLPREKVLSRDLFTQMERCARKKVIIFVPNGFIENDLVDGDPYQAHMSAWEPDDYTSRGYRVKGATGLRYLFGKASRPKYRPYGLCAIIGMLTQPYVYNRPHLAWHSYAVKEL